MKKFKLVFAILTISVMVLCSCDSENTPSTSPTPSMTSGVSDKKTVYPLTFTDFEGSQSVIKEAPQRVISISPALTEIVTALDGTKRLVGRTSYCDYPANISEVKDIGDMYSPNIELIIEQEPDLVLVSAHTNPEVLETLRNNGITAVRIFQNDDFDGCYQMILDIGKLLDRTTEAESVVSDMKEKVEGIMKSVEGKSKPSVYYLVDCGEYGDFAATGDTFIGQMIEMAGGENAAKDGSMWAYSLEKLLEKDPDMIICGAVSGYATRLSEFDGYKDLTAVINGRVYEIDNNLIDRMGPRLADGLQLLADCIAK